jgi:hypothetical protein
MRVVAVLLLGACAGESGGGGGLPQRYDDWYVRYPAYPDSASPVVLDGATPMLSVHLRSSLMLTTSRIQNTSEYVDLRMHVDYTRARIRVSVYPDGGDPMTDPGRTIELGGPGAVGTNFEHDMYMRSFEDCLSPCVRTEDYRFDVEFLEGDPTTVSWYASNSIRLQELEGEDVPADDETFTLEVVAEP